VSDRAPIPDPEPLHIHLLGGFRVTVGERAIPETAWRLRKARSLVKLLALAPGHQLHREQLWDRLWPDLTPEAAANNLHRTLHAARRALAPTGGGTPAAAPYLQLRGELLRLAPPEVVWTDVAAFEEAVGRARGSEDPAAYQAALALYAGDLLPEDRYEDWAAERREPLRQRYLGLLAEVAALYEARQAHDSAVEALGQLLAADPAHEEAHRGLMRLYARGGQRQQALRQYQTLREALERELGAEPDAESRRLEQQIREGRFPPAVAARADTPDRADVTAVVPATGSAEPVIHTFLIADVRGYTRYTLEQGDPAAAQLAARLAELARAAVTARGGQVIELRGDEAVAVFASARQALRAAVELQARLAEASQADPTRPLPVGIGLDAGEAVPLEGGYRGAALNLAARLCSLAGPGEVLASEGLIHLARRVEGLAYTDRGTVQLKGFAEPVHVLLVQSEEMAGAQQADAPAASASPEHAAPTTGQPRRHNLPAQLTSFIGREPELAELSQLLGTTRQLTLAGPGGCGKTRLALALAGQVLGTYPDGVWLVELAGLSDPGLVPQAVASALGVPEQAGRPLTETLAAYLEERRVLLLLDNCEHLVGACATLAEALLRACPDLRLLVTSREPLRIPGELTWRVPSLSLPDPAMLPPVGDLAAYEAVRLFVERARAIRPGFVLTEQTAPAVAHLCHRLDGMPLALELAAARIGTLTPEQIAARLDDSMALLTGGSRTALTRQQTLRAALDWSHALLEESERALLRRLAVFAGGFSLEAAEEVTPGDGVERAAVLDLLAQLVDKSLLVAEADEALARYRLLEPVRQYAWSKLQTAGEAAGTQRRHWAWCLDFAQRAEAQLRGPEHTVWLGRLEREHDNLRAAMSWGGHEDPAAGLQLAGVMLQFWLLRGYLQEGRQWLNELLAAAPEESALFAEALLWECALAMRQVGPSAQAFAWAERSLAMYKALGEWLGSAHIAYTLAAYNFFVSDYARVEALLAESLALAQEAGYAPGCASVAQVQALLAWHRGEWTQAHTLLEDSLAQWRAIAEQPDLSFRLLSPVWGASGYGRGALARLQVWEDTFVLFRRVPPRAAIGYVLASAGTYARLEGDYPRARAALQEALAGFRALGDRSGMAQVLAQLGHLARCEGDYARARTLLEESLAQHQEVGERRSIAIALSNLGVLAAVEGDYPRAHALLDESQALGRKMADAVGYGNVLYNLSYLAACEGDYGRARALLQEQRQTLPYVVVPPLLVNLGILARLERDRAASREYFEKGLALFRAIGNRRGSAELLADLGGLDLEEGDLQAARVHFGESLVLARAMDDGRTLAAALEGVAVLAVAVGPESAIRLAGAAAALDPERQEALEQRLGSARAAVAEGAYAAAWADGQVMGIERAVEEAQALCREDAAIRPTAERSRRGPKARR
jgi:predicted ATPase/class 3 adenylate cyclase